MNIINALKKYNVKNGELKRLNSKYKEINLKLDNWDRLKASTITDMPTHHDTDNRDKVGNIVISREQLEEDRMLLELKIAELDSLLLEVDSRLDCLKAEYKYILCKVYKDNLRISHFIKEYNDKFGIAEYETIKNYKNYAIKELLKL